MWLKLIQTCSRCLNISFTWNWVHLIKKPLHGLFIRINMLPLDVLVHYPPLFRASAGCCVRDVVRFTDRNSNWQYTVFTCVSACTLVRPCVDVCAHVYSPSVSFRFGGDRLITSEERLTFLSRTQSHFFLLLLLYPLSRRRSHCVVRVLWPRQSSEFGRDR